MPSKTCSRCNQDGLSWAVRPDDTYYLAAPGGNAHTCPPVTRRTGLQETLPVSSDNMSAIAQAALMDVVAKVTESFHRTLETETASAEGRISKILSHNYEDIREYISERMINAQEEFRLLMPQQHEIVVCSPIGTTTTEGRPHYQLPRLINWLNMREHVMTVGPAGSGKTTSAVLAADALSLPHYLLPCGMATNDWSLLGFISPTGSYVPGHMRQPYEHGGVFILDEIDNTNPSVLTTINGALSGNSYQFPDSNIHKHPDFVVVGCANTYGTGPDRLYVGRNQLDAATLDRFKKMSWGYDEEAEFDWAGRDQTEWVRYVQRVRACAAQLSMRVVISPRASIGGAKGLRNGLPRNEVAEDCLWNGMSEDDSSRLREVV